MAKKKYEYKTTTIRLPDGRRKYIRAKTKKELEEKVKAAQRELSLGVDISSDITFREYAENWLLVRKAPYLTPNTVVRHRARMENHVYPIIGSMKVREIRASHILYVMRGISSLGRGSQSQVLGALRNIFNLAVDDNLILRSPVPLTLTAAGETTKESEPLTLEQEAEILRVSEGHSLYPFVYIALHTGMRRGEITGLMWSDVDFDHEVIHVRRHAVTDAVTGRAELVDGAKTDAGVRDIPMPKQLIAYLRKRMSESRSLYVVPNGKGQIYSSSLLSHKWANLQKRLSFKVHPHQLRHTYITKLFEAGLDIKQIQYVAGHADESMTLKVYTHYRKNARHSDTIRQIQAAF